MMGLVSGSEILDLDRSIGIPSPVLMESAGAAVASIITELFSIQEKTRVLVVCGPGNNGADGLVVARRLAAVARGWSISVLLVGEMKSEEGRKNLNLLEKFGIAFTDIASANVDEFDVIVDGLLGAGSRAGIPEKYERLINSMNFISAKNKRNECKIISIDIPSGVCPTSGRALIPNPIQAHITVTFGLIKSGLVFYPGRRYGGKLILSNISYPHVFSGKNLSTWVNPVPLLNYRNDSGHKGSFGKGLFVAGSNEYFGAPFFASLAFLKAGGGYSRLSTSAAVASVVAIGAPEVVMVPEESYSKYLTESDVIVVGPGLGLSEKADFKLKAILDASIPAIPIVIDGDALNLLKTLDRLEKSLGKGSTVVLTPHKGEWIRLFSDQVEDVDEKISDYHMIMETRRVIKRFETLPGELIVVCKGPSTGIVSSKPNGAVFVNLSGNPNLATCGSGDVLAGLIAALLCNPPGVQGSGESVYFSAVGAAVFIHGLASDLGPQGAPMTASDVMNNVPEAVRLCLKDPQSLRAKYVPRLVV